MEATQQQDGVTVTGDAPITIAAGATPSEFTKDGAHVVYFDHHGKVRAALVTRAWSPEKPNPTINLVYVTDDASRTDGYGQQIIRETSVPHFANTTAPGNYWRATA